MPIFFLEKPDLETPIRFTKRACLGLALLCGTSHTGIAQTAQTNDNQPIANQPLADQAPISQPQLQQVPRQATPQALPTTRSPILSVGQPESLADLVERISPAVVNIKVTTDSGETTTLGQGSGFIISSKGEVVTNYHVIEGGDNIAIEFNNGESLPANVMGTDAETDLALLQIDYKRNFPTVPFYHGDKIRIGDYVIALSLIHI